MFIPFAVEPLQPSGQDIEVESHLFEDDGTYPNNNKLRLIVYLQAFCTIPDFSPEAIENVFCHNNWVNSWRNGLYTFHHYHSTAHEVLGIYSGWVKAQFGGSTGKVIYAKKGDVIVVPAGVSHRNIEQSSDFRVIGAYPKGQMWDMNYGNKGERPLADRKICEVPLPDKDPVFGKNGPLPQLWKE